MSDQDPTHGDGGDQPTPPPPPPPPPPPTSGPGPMPPAAYGGSTAGQPADVGVRLGARVIDAILIAIVNAAVTFPIFVGAMFAEGASSNPFFTGGITGAGIVASLLSLIITFAYYVLMDTRLGKTVGKMLLNLEVKGTAGGLPTVEESFKRNAWMLLSVIPIIGGLLQLAAAIYIAVTISNSPSNVGWHDEFAGGTRVVRTN